MARTLHFAGPIAEHWSHVGRAANAGPAGRTSELGRCLLWLIPLRAAVLFLGLNLGRLLGILPESLGGFRFVPFFNILSTTLTLFYLALWWNGWRLSLQLWLQIGVDLALTSVIVACTGGIDSPFTSFYLLVIIYCSLTLGSRGALIGAASSTALYSFIAGVEPLGAAGGAGTAAELEKLSFRISLNALGFIAVAFLGTYLSQRLHQVQEELEEKIGSLRQLQKLNEHIVGSIRSGLVTTDLGGSITLFNSTAEELTGRPGREVLGTPFPAVFGRDFWERIAAGALLENPRPLRHEAWVSSSKGERRFLGFSVSPLLDHERRLIGYTVAFQDLTDIRQLEEEVRVKDRLATIGRMAAGIAHEIRNPLTSMRGSVEILRSHVSLPKPQARLLDILIRESDRLNEFVEDLLYFARPGKYSRQPTDLGVLLRDSVALLRNCPEVRSRHAVELQIEGENIFIMGNADKLKQVFWNLAQNALRAMPEGGKLNIRAGKSPGGAVTVAFADTGVGLSQEEKNLLFQPFHSGFASGTGLGLSIVFQILEDHGGKIQFESEKGRGTRVILSFPPLASNVAH